MTGTMMMIASLAGGALIGELINLEDRLATFGEWLKERSGSSSDSSFVEGFVTASLTVCIGAWPSSAPSPTACRATMPSSLPRPS